MLPHLVVVSCGETAQRASGLIRQVLHYVYPSNLKHMTPPPDREAMLWVSAQWLILHNRLCDSGKDEPADFIRIPRWIALSAEYSTDGIEGFDGCPAFCLNDLSLNEGLKQDIATWNRELEQRVSGTLPAHLSEMSEDEWVAQHDARGLKLALRTDDELNGGIPFAKRMTEFHSDRHWVVRFHPLGDMIPAEDTAEKTAPPGDELPPLTVVHDTESLKDAMEMHTAVRRAAHIRGGLLVCVAEPYRSWLLAQEAVILRWCRHETYSFKPADRDRLPRNRVGAARYVRIMADNSSTGIWDWDGSPVDADDIPLSGESQRRIENWLSLYEKARTWDNPSRRPFIINENAFNCMGKRIVSRLRRELPEWDIGYT